jgi:hypothetical protein
MKRVPKFITSERLRGVGAAWVILSAGWMVLGIAAGDTEAIRYIAGGILVVLGVTIFIIGSVMVGRNRTSAAPGDADTPGKP